MSDYTVQTGGERVLNVRHPEAENEPKLPEGQVANNLAPAAEAVGARAPNPAIHGTLPSAGRTGERAASDASLDEKKPGGPGGKPKLDKFAYGFFAPQMAPFRKIAFKILGSTTVLSVIVMWLCLPVYWGSLWKSNKYTDRLTVRIIDRDGGAIGSAISQGLLAYHNLQYYTTAASDFPTDADVYHNVVEQGSWAAVVISAGATTALEIARQNGNSSYNGSSAVSIIYAQARNENAVNSYLVPYLEQALGQVTGQYNAESTAQYLQANAANQTAITLLAQAPTTITQPVFYQMVNLRPYNQPVANAITLVGLIYMLIFAFIITMTNNAVREIIAPFLTTRAYIAYRIIAPLSIYLVLAFFFAMVNLPFKVHFGAHFTYAGGFFLWAFILYLGMASVGLATEFAITILGPKFMAFFLIPLIIVNVSVATFPHELQPWIFRYGAAMPFYNVGRAVRTIIFNTKNEIGQNCGILVAWIVFSIVTISVATWAVRRKSVNAHRRAMGENEKDTVTPDGRIV